MSPPVAGFVVYLITIYKVKKEQAFLIKLKRLKIVSLYSDLLIYGNKKHLEPVRIISTQVSHLEPVCIISTQVS